MTKKKVAPGLGTGGAHSVTRGHKDATPRPEASQVVPPAASQALTTLACFQRLYSDATGWLVLWTLPDKRSRWYEVPGQLPLAAEDAAKQARDHDVFFAVGLQAERVKRGRGSAESVCFIPVVWADIDVAGEGHAKGKVYFESKDAARAFLGSLPVKPTIIVDSGHGLHGYWILRDPLVIASPQDREYAIKILAGWQAYLQAKAKALGYDIDATADLARVLRVPGTVNRKGDPLPVKVLVADGSPVNASELLEYAPAPSIPVPVQASMAGDITVDPLAEPPGKFVAVLDNDLKTKRTWNRARREMKDTSASAYDLALADVLVVAGWPDQEICNTLVAFRRRHGDDLKRLDYYRTTIGKARAARQPIIDALAAIEEGTATADPAAKLARVRETLHLPLARVVQRALANEPAEFSLVLDSGEDIRVGSASDMLSQRHIRAIVYESAGRVIPLLKQTEWEKVAQLLADIWEVEQLSEELTDHGEVRILLGEYLERTTVLREGPDGSHPFMRDSAVYIVGSHFRYWCKLRHVGDFSGARLGRALDLLGVHNKIVYMVLKKVGRTTRSCWRLPPNLLPPGVMPAAGLPANGAL